MNNFIFIENNEIKKVNEIKLDTKNNEIYEVIRCENGIPLFYEMHYNRLKNSLKSVNAKMISKEEFKENIEKLIKLNNLISGNIRFSFKDLKNIYFYMNNDYVTLENQKNGVDTILFSTTRENPNIKKFDKNMRLETESLIKSKNVFEALLVDEFKNIREGSRTNFFAFKDDNLISPPYKDALIGITKMNVFDICKLEKINIIEKEISSTSLHEYDGFILTGTTIKILPVNKIENQKFNSSKNKNIIKLIDLYNNKIQEYIKNY